MSARAAPANVITDWDEKAVGLVVASAAGERIMAMVHVAMFDAVNAIERRYRPYLVELPASPDASKEAAAASAAAGILVGVPGQDAAAVKAALDTYLGGDRRRLPRGRHVRLPDRHRRPRAPLRQLGELHRARARRLEARASLL